MAEAVVSLFTEEAADIKAIKQAQIDFEIRQSGGPALYYFEMATVWEDVGELDQAEEAYRTSLDSAPNNSIVLSRLARLLTQMGRVSESEVIHRRAIKQDEDNFEAQIAWARFLMQQKNDAKNTVRIATEILKNNPSHFEANVLLSEVYLAKSWPNLAVKTLKQCKEHFPDEAHLRILIGYAHLLSEQFGEAKVQLKEVVEGRFSNEHSRKYGTDSELTAKAYYFLAMVAQREANAVEFDKCLQGTLRFDPSHLDARMALAALAYGHKDLGLARSHLEKILTRDLAALPPMENVFTMLPMPMGVVDVVEILRGLGKENIALEALNVGAQMAKEQGKIDLVQQFETMARTNGL